MVGMSHVISARLDLFTKKKTTTENVPVVQ
jgi:hypothetical protein